MAAWRAPVIAETPDAIAIKPIVPPPDGAGPPFAPDDLIARYADTPSETSASQGASGDSRWARGEQPLAGFVVEDEELGRGGMGQVLLVRRVSSDYLYAVKRAHPLERFRAGFLAELWTWIDLPSHPHIVRCHFFHTIEQDIAIFSEYVRGAPLSKLIKDRTIDGVAERLDIAIQAAWALEALHALGLVHQDVKPANLLVRDDGVVKLADFGLTAARARLAQANGGLTANDGTQSYRSPEQAQRQKLTHASDVWSFGVSVLEMFTGRAPTWGELADSYLEDVIAGRYQLACPLSDGLVHVLRKCLKRDPAQRWTTLGEAAGRLCKAYTVHTGRRYQRVKPPLPQHTPAPHDGTQRHTHWGVEWDDPAPYLEAAIEASGSDHAAATTRKIAAASAASLTGRALVDIALYEEARRRYRALVESGRANLVELSRVCHEKALVHAHLGDAIGATALFQEARQHLEAISPPSSQDLRDIAASFINQGLAALHLEDPAAGLRAQAAAAKILQPLVAAGDLVESGPMLAKAYFNLSGALTHLGRRKEASTMLMQALDFHEWLLTRHIGAADDLAETCFTMAKECAEGYPEGAMILCDRMARLLAGLAKRTPKHNALIAEAEVVRGRAIARNGDYTAGARRADHGIAMLTKLANARPELRPTLAETLGRRGLMASDAGRKAEAIQFLERAIGLYRDSVLRGGSYEFESELDFFIRAHANLVAGRPAY